MTISFKGGFSFSLQDAAMSTNRDLKEGLDTKSLSNLDEFKTYTPNSFKLDIGDSPSRPYYKVGMDFMERKSYESALNQCRQLDKEAGKLTILDETSGDKFVLSSKVTNENGTVNPDKFQNALNELSLDRIKGLSMDFYKKITEYQNEIKKESANNALDKIFRGL